MPVEKLRNFRILCRSGPCAERCPELLSPCATGSESRLLPRKSVESMPTRPIRTFTVLPHLPERLQALQKLAYNLWWCWNPEAVALFRRIDAEVFEDIDHNPVKLLGKVDQQRLQELLDDDGFLSHLDRVEVLFDIYMNAATWYQEKLASGSFARSSSAAGHWHAAIGHNGHKQGVRGRGQRSVKTERQTVLRLPWPLNPGR